MINDIISNSDTQLVTSFKEHSIYNNNHELLKAFHSYKVSSQSITELSTLYSKVMPSFVILEERRYFLKNIKRKKKILYNKRKEFSNEKISSIGEKMFTKKFLEEITIRCSRTLTKESFHELLDDFIYKDSLSLIQRTGCNTVEATFCKLTSKSPNQNTSKRKHLVIVKDNNLLGIKSNINKTKPIYRRHESQKEIAKDKKLTNGRMSSAGNYSIKGSFKDLHSPRFTKKINIDQRNNTNKLLSSKKSQMDADPFQIKHNENKERSETPHACVAFHNGGKSKKQLDNGESAYQLNKPINVKNKEKEELKKESKVRLKKREESSLAKKFKLNDKEISLGICGSKLLKQKTNKGRISITKKLAMNHLCKSIKDLLSPLKTINKRVGSPSLDKDKKKKDSECIKRRGGHYCRWSDIDSLKETLKVTKK